MTREEKNQEIQVLKETLENTSYFYLTDSSTLDVATINKFRRLCFDKGITFKVAKNTLIKKALEQLDEDYSELYDALKGPTSIMISSASNAPAKVLKSFREESDMPVLKAAYIDTDVFLGDDKIDELSKLKSKEELIGDIIALLEGPINQLVGSLNSGSANIAGLLKALEERGEE
jgi:large subunit ribosomal protein L10